MLLDMGDAFMISFAATADNNISLKFGPDTTASSD